MQTDIAVIGAGPAGLAAAVAAAESGSRVVLLDAGDRPGGQYFRHGSGKFDRRQRLAGSYVKLRQRMAVQQKAGRITYLSRTSVVMARELDDEFEIRARKGEREQSPVEIRADRIVLATGAHDRVLPFRGWQLPGSVSVGGAQALVKGAQTLVGSRVVLGGTGPFLLAAAASLIDHGARVLAVVEASQIAGLAADPRALRLAPDRLLQGAGLVRKLLLHGARLHQSARITAALGAERVNAVEIASHSRTIRYECDAVATGWGFVPQLEVAEQLGLEFRTGAFNELCVLTDSQQRSSNLRVWAAGEIAGVAGVESGLIEGELAGLAAAGAGAVELRDLARKRDRQREFAGLLAAHYPIPGDWHSQVADDVLVCRCEEVTAGEIRQAQQAGAGDLRGLKVSTRAGMGWCQGRICAVNCAEMVNGHTALTAEMLSATARRPVATPIPLGLLAQWDERLG